MNIVTLMDHPWTVAWRLILIVIASGIVGYERERLRKPAGFRTHILVGVGSTLMMLTSLLLPELYPDLKSIDPARIAAQVVVGIGFLGAGTIMHSKEGWVSGLTTAASLWVVAGIGLAIGIGFYSAALITTALVIIVLYFLNRIDDYIDHHLYHSVMVSAVIRPTTIEAVKTVLRESQVLILKTDLQFSEEHRRLIVIQFKPIKVQWGHPLAQKLEKIRGVKEVVFG